MTSLVNNNNIKKNFLRYFYIKEPVEWKKDLTWWYKISSFSPTVLGLYIKYYKIYYIKKYGYFPWDIESILLICTGPLSYMGDVHTFGRYSLWKTADVVVCSSAVAIISTFIPLNILRKLYFPKKMNICFGIVKLLSLYCKLISGQELRKSDNDETISAQRYILYHSLWHYIMCGGSIACLHFTC